MVLILLSGFSIASGIKYGNFANIVVGILWLVFSVILFINYIRMKHVSSLVNTAHETAIKFVLSEIEQLKDTPDAECKEKLKIMSDAFLRYVEMEDFTFAASISDTTFIKTTLQEVTFNVEVKLGEKEN